VTVPAGATSATFTFTTTVVGSSVNGSVKAQLGATSKLAYLTIRPIGVLSLTFNPTSVTGGGTPTGTVTLEAPAAPGPVTVTLTSNNAAGQVPASLTIPAGATTGTFTVTTSAVTTTTYVTVSASAGGVRKSATVTVKP
jgi:trimeric autotransporter adhesin